MERRAADDSAVLEARTDLWPEHVETSEGGVKHNGENGLGSLRGLGKRPAIVGPATDMADPVLIQPETENRSAVPSMTGHELDAFLGKAFEEKSVIAGLYENIRDLFFPVKLPPLELTSTPIPVPDRMAVKTNPWATGISTTINLMILAIALFWVGKKVIEKPKQTEITTPIDVGDYKPIAPQKDVAMGGGGGGGSKELIDPNKGKLPKISQQQITPPQVPVDKPKLAIESSINVQKDIILPDNPSMPMIGVKNSPNVRLASNGQGTGAGMGTGHGGGLGSGNGNGYGPGSGGNTGGGLYRVGGGISAPSVLFAPEAEFSDEARRAKYQGVCLISVIVDAQGNPVNPRVVRTLGMGLDEKALEAVRKYKFRPAMKDSKTPVPVMINIEVNFRLY